MSETISTHAEDYGEFYESDVFTDPHTGLMRIMQKRIWPLRHEFEQLAEAQGPGTLRCHIELTVDTILEWAGL